jgi:hypothetical protein
MPFNIFNREYTTKRVTLANQSTTTELKPTTSTLSTTDVAVGGYSEMAVVCNVLANAAGASGIYMQVSPDGGTTWGNRITLDADMTTTANLTYVGVDKFGDTVRVFAVGATTTSSARYTVKAVLKR